MANIISRTSGNDTLLGGSNDTIIGGGGNDTYIVSLSEFTITDFGGIGQGTSPTAAVIAEVDTLRFGYTDYTAKNLLLTQNGSNLEITFERDNRSSSYFFTKVTLQNFALENLDNLSTSTGATVDLGNIVFYGQTRTDSLDVLNANSTQSTIFNKNTVTFLNDLNNTVDGFDDSDDVINGQGGDDIIDGKSGNDLLRGGAGDNLLIGGVGNDTLNVESSTGDNTLNGGTGNDTLNANYSAGNNLLSGGDGNDSLIASFALISNAPPFDNFDDPDDFLNSSGNNSLNGGAGNDILNANYSTGNNFLSGGDGNDFISASGDYRSSRGNNFIPYAPISGNNILNGDAGNDTLNSNYSTGDNTLNGGAGGDILLAEISTGNNLLSGGDGNDSLSVSGYLITSSFSSSSYTYRSSGNNTLDGGAGNDTLSANYSTGNNLLSGNDGNDSLSISAYYLFVGNKTLNGGISEGTLNANYPSSGNNTLNGGIGDDTLNASGSSGNNFLSGDDGNDFFYLSPTSPDTAPTSLVTQTVDGGNDNDLLFLDYRLATGGITTTFNTTTNIGSITAGTYLVTYKNIEQLNISGSAYNDNIVGSNGNDTLTGGVGNDKFVYEFYSYGSTDIITDFSGVGKGSNASEAVIASLDTLQFTGYGFTARNLQLTQNGNNLEITFGNDTYNKVILQNFKLENLDNLPATSSQSAIGNILFDGQTSITDSFDVFDGDSTQTNLFNKNTVTFLNDLDNNITGFDNSNDVINGQGGDDIIDGLSGNDLLRGGAGNNTLIGGAGDDIFDLSGSTGDNLIFGGDGTDTFIFTSYDEGINTIDDFNATNELIQLQSYSFGDELSVGSVQTSQFTIGTSATTSEERFIYNSATGALFFDQDGNASGFTQVQFAQLSTGLLLTNNNFVVV